MVLSLRSDCGASRETSWFQAGVFLTYVWVSVLGPPDVVRPWCLGLAGFELVPDEGVRLQSGMPCNWSRFNPTSDNWGNIHMHTLVRWTLPIEPVFGNVDPTLVWIPYSWESSPLKRVSPTLICTRTLSLVVDVGLISDPLQFMCGVEMKHGCNWRRERCRAVYLRLSSTNMQYSLKFK